MNILKIYGIGIAVSVTICLLVFDVISVSTAPMNCLFVFLSIIHLIAIVQIILLLMADRMLLSDLKLSFEEIVPTIVKAAIASILLALVVYIIFEHRISIFLEFLAVGVLYSLVRSITIKSRNSIIWCTIVLSLSITGFIFHYLFLINLELLALLCIIIGGFSLRCVQCRTWWGQKLIDQIVLKEYKKAKVGIIRKTITGHGTGRDWGREFQIDVNEYYTYYIITRLYREYYCCEVCKHKTSKEVLKKKGLFGWEPVLFRQKQ